MGNFTLQFQCIAQWDTKICMYLGWCTVYIKYGRKQLKKKMLVLRKSLSLREAPFYVTLKCIYGEQNHTARVFRRHKFCYPKLILNRELEN